MAGGQFLPTVKVCCYEARGTELSSANSVLQTMFGHGYCVCVCFGGLGKGTRQLWDGKLSTDRG